VVLDRRRDFVLLISSNVFHSAPEDLATTSLRQFIHNDNADKTREGANLPPHVIIQFFFDISQLLCTLLTIALQDHECEWTFTLKVIVEGDNSCF